MLTPGEREALLDLAANTIRRYVNDRVVFTPPDVQDPALLAPCGAFVTLHAHGQLRGCIGLIEARRPLWETVRDMAIAAAVEDPRFSPVTAEELNDLDLEISVLSVPVPLLRIEDIHIGRDGLIVRQGAACGVLLPQVATEWGWTREEFLAQTCGKAGLPPQAWRTGATVVRFSAEVFGRKPAPPPA